jgi:hypothetical protein
MADTSVQGEVARFICDTVLPARYGQSFSRERIRLSSGGDHSFAAVSADRRIVGTICTGSASTAGGKLAVGKLNKVRADLYFLLLAEAETKFIVAVQPVMRGLLTAERDEYRRIPSDIEIVGADIPAELRARLRISQDEASAEVSPGG